MAVTLSRADRRALRDLLIAATAGDRSRTSDALGRAPVEWLPTAVARHRVSAPVLATLRTMGAPDGLLASLQSDVTRDALRHLAFVGVLHEVATAFDRERLRWLVMKGPVLAGHHYVDLGGRGYSDLDLLVDRRDFPDAVRLLEALGFSHAIRNWPLAEKMLAGQVGLRRGAIRIDLHWQLHYARQDRRPYHFEPSRMVGRSRRIDVSGADVPTFDAVDTLITLAFHAARSGGHALVWSKDLERALAVDQPDLDQVVRSSREARCAPAVGLMLHRARDLVGADVPDDIVTGLVPRSLTVVGRAVVRVSPPVQPDGRGALDRFAMRSVGPTAFSSVTAFPSRLGRQLARSLFPPAVHETDDPGEKASYLRAVAASEE